MSYATLSTTKERLKYEESQVYGGILEYCWKVEKVEFRGGFYYVKVKMLFL